MSVFINLSLFRRNRDFRYLYLGQFISFIGSMITSVAAPYQVYHETNSTLMVGLLSLCLLVPLLFTALIGGVLADRHDKRKLILMTESLLVIGTLFLAINANLETPRVWVIFVIAGFMSAVTGLHRPALESIVQKLVSYDDYAMVGALNSFKYGFCSIVGPAMGGLIIAHFGLVCTYLVDVFSFTASILAILQISTISKIITNSESSIWGWIKEGFQYAKSRQELLGSYFVDFVAMIFGVPTALFPAIAQLHGGPEFLGMLYSAPAVSTLILSAFSGWLEEIKSHGKAIAICASLWGIAIIFFGLSSNIWIALFFLALSGVFDGLSGIFRQTLWNKTIPHELRGRLSGIEMISYLSGPRLGDTEAGLVAAAFGVTFSIVSGGVLCVAGVGICLFLT